MKARRLVSSFAVAAVMLLVQRAHAAEPEAVRFEVDAPDGCVNEPDLRAEVGALGATFRDANLDDRARRFMSRGADGGARAGPPRRARPRLPRDGARGGRRELRGGDASPSRAVRRDGARRDPAPARARAGAREQFAGAVARAGGRNGRGAARTRASRRLRRARHRRARCVRRRDVCGAARLRRRPRRRDDPHRAGGCGDA